MHKNRYIHKQRSPVYILLFIILFLIAFAASGYLRVSNIDCYTQFGVCRPEFASALTWLQNYPILRPLPTGQINRHLSKFTDIKSVTVYRRLPTTMVVSILLRSPAGLVGSSVLGAYAVADDTGYVYQNTTTGNYPVLLFPTLPSINTKLDQNAVIAMKSLTLMSNLTDKKIIGSITADTLIATISGETETLIDLSSPYEKWYASLQLILNRSKMRGKMPRKIDLRFDSSVITY